MTAVETIRALIVVGVVVVIILAILVITDHYEQRRRKEIERKCEYCAAWPCRCGYCR